MKVNEEIRSNQMYLFDNEDLNYDFANPVDTIANSLLFNESREMRHLNEFAQIIAKTANTLCLIQGETGTEKHQLAALIHFMDITRHGALRFVNCEMYDGTELLNRLFGQVVKNGSERVRLRGEFENAHCGTLVLENIEKVSEEVQLRLLLFFETRSFRRIDSNIAVNTDTRVIATTSYDLERFVIHGRFSRDLYFRFKAFEVTIPPLRKRTSDILPLAYNFLEEYSKKFGRKITGMSPEVEQKLIDYAWPGNMEELRIIIERIILLNKEGIVKLSSLPDDLGQQKATDYESDFLGNCSLREIEKLHIEKALLRTKGNKSKAAEILNISRTTLREKMRLFNLNR